MLTRFLRRLFAAKASGRGTAAGRPSETDNAVAAAAFYKNALRADSNHAEAQYHLGVILGRNGRYAAAEGLLCKVVAREPDSIDALNALANVLRLQQRPLEAIEFYRRALEIDAGASPVWTNLALSLHDAGRHDQSIEALDKALALEPTNTAAQVNLAKVWDDLGESAKAHTLLLKVIAACPDLVEAHVELAQILLRRGDFAAGWREYEWRLQAEKWHRGVSYECPVWGGSDLSERSLLVTAEQGFGDEIMFASCLPDVLANTRHCIVETHPRLAALFSRSFGDAIIRSSRVTSPVDAAERTIAPDFKIAIGSLPLYLRRKVADFPQHRGYLSPASARVDYWRGRLDRTGAKYTVGISWRGGTSRTRQAQRSTDLAVWLPLLRENGCHFVSLQYGDVGPELAAITHDGPIHISHWQEAIDDYDETAALVCALDLVISVQTSVVHLTGALGRPAWVLVPANAEWRYLEKGESMPWYPSVRLFRQQQAGEWQSVIAAVGAELAPLVRNARCC